MFCPHCRAESSPSEIKRVMVGNSELLACPRCDGVIMQSESRVVKPLVGELATAFAYPFRPLTLVVSVVIVMLAGAAGFIPVVGGVIGAGIRFGWLFAILRASSDGREDVEVDASDIGANVFGWMGPAVRVFIVTFIAFVPAATALVLTGGYGSFIAGTLALLGLLYFPAGIIAAAEASTWYAPLNPLPAVALITRIPAAYFTACALLIVLYAVSAGAIVLALSIEVPFVGMILAGLLGYLPLVAAARMLGILVYEKREEL